MSSGSSFETKEQVKRSINIVDLVGRYLSLRREGRGYKAICPWHDDTRPSLQVNPERQSFKCWVCDIGGDIFSFIMQIEGVTFPEALAMLAEQAGIKLERGGVSGGSTDDKKLLHQAMAWAEEQYHQFLLKAPAAAPARNISPSAACRTTACGASIWALRLTSGNGSWPRRVTRDSRRKSWKPST